MSAWIQSLQERLKIEQMIQQMFPKLARGQFALKSPYDPEYNCVGFAAKDEDRRWWPTDLRTAKRDYYWPEKAPREETLEAFIATFQLEGYKVCEGAEHEEGFEKVAIYATDKREPKHMARQLETGVWKSKLGDAWDIEHQDVDGVAGKRYGRPSVFMRRQLQQVAVNEVKSDEQAASEQEDEN
jgi:hypothetical protein